MFQRILIPLENSRADETIIAYIRRLARAMGSKLILMHVADGFAARNQEALDLDDSEEIRADRAYLARRADELGKDGFEVTWILACGEPTNQIVDCAKKHDCDLIAMATHGHRFFEDMVLGSVASGVRHKTDVPVLLVRAPKPRAKSKPPAPPKKPKR